MKKLFYLMLLAMFVAISSYASTERDVPTIKALIDSLHLPPTTHIAAESNDLLCFVNVDSIYDEISEATTLWTYRPSKGELKKLLSANYNYDDEGTCYGGKDWKKLSISILNIGSVYVNASENKLLITGSGGATYSNSYIITLCDDLPTIQLPCSAGVFGLTGENEYIVCQSREYYKGGGAYNVVLVFDWKGKQLGYISLKNK